MFPWLAWWRAIPGYVVFVGLLFFWQRIRALLCGPKLVFLDRLCISQHDDDRKEQGILGLANFLDNSKSLTILWSPRYFSRVWCSFELASFFRQDSGKWLRLMPTSLGTMCFVMWCGGGSCAVAYVITKYAFPKLVSNPTNPPSWILLLETQTLFIIGMITGTILFSYASSLMTAIRALPSQLSTYNIDQCECYCFSNDHKDLSGRTIQCDHALVFNTIWIDTRTPMSSEVEGKVQ